jgi:hypothetical protein
MARRVRRMTEAEADRRSVARFLAAPTDTWRWPDPSLVGHTTEYYPADLAWFRHPILTGER